MKWIYLSPHLDDVVLSLGGLVWEQTQTGTEVEIWTICAGDPPPGPFSLFAESLHARWETGTQSMPIRRAEDQASCQRLGASFYHFSIPDCIYRRSPVSGEHLYASEDALWEPVHPDEETLIIQIGEQIQAKLPAQAQVVCPMTIGNHVDHRLTRAAAERMGRPLWFYADYPYVLQNEHLTQIKELPSQVTKISNSGITAWQEAVAAHHSQLSTFWQNPGEMEQAIQFFANKMGGVRLFFRG